MPSPQEELVHTLDLARTVLTRVEAFYRILGAAGRDGVTDEDVRSLPDQWRREFAGELARWSSTWRPHPVLFRHFFPGEWTPAREEEARALRDRGVARLARVLIPDPVTEAVETPAEDGVSLVDGLLRDTEGYEDHQRASKLNNGLRAEGVDPAPVYVELIRRGRTWFLTPLRDLDSDSVARALPGLLEVVPDSLDRDLREVVWYLGLAAVPALDAAVSGHRDGRVRERAAECLRELGPEAAAVPSLVAVLRDPRTGTELAGRAAAALGGIGVATPDVLAALTEALGREVDIPGITPVADALDALRAAEGGTMSSSVGRLLAAIDFAAHKHRGQRRKSADAPPYINHPIGVARLLAEVGGVADEAVLAAAVLHDTLEDTDTTADELEARFGPAVRRLVEEVTDDKARPSAERKRLQIAHAPGLSPGAALIKLGDKIANCRDLSLTPPADWSADRAREYLDWAEAVVGAMPKVNPALEARFAEVVAAGRRAVAAGSAPPAAPGGDS